MEGARFADEAWTEVRELAASCRYSDEFEMVENDPELGSVESLIAYKDALEERLVSALVSLGQAADDAGWDG